MQIANNFIISDELSPGFLQQRQLHADIGHFFRITHALGLDLQNRDLVQYFTR